MFNTLLLAPIDRSQPLAQEIKDLLPFSRSRQRLLGRHFFLFDLLQHGLPEFEVLLHTLE